jgi:3-oxoadipate enol-lactonase
VDRRRPRPPSLIIVGEHDFICGPAWNRPLADAIPGAVYAEIPGVGHFPQYEAPDEFRRVVLAWLASQPG